MYNTLYNTVTSPLNYAADEMYCPDGRQDMRCTDSTANNYECLWLISVSVRRSEMAKNHRLSKVLIDR